MFNTKNKNRNKKLLQDLKKNEINLMVSDSKNQFTGRILDVLADGDRFLFDLIHEKERHVPAPGPDELIFFGELYGQHIEFKCKNIEETIVESLPAFISKVPDHISITQRRENYRVKFPESSDYFCRGKLANNSNFQFRVADISVGGIGLYIDNAVVFPIKKSEIIRGAVVNFNEFGEFFFDLQYIQTIQRKVFNKNGTMTSKWMLSFQFEDLEKIKEKELARLVMELQQDQAAKSGKFKMSM